MNKIYNGDCLEVLKDLDENSVHAIITDPPYGLDLLDHNWDKKTVDSTKNMKVVTSLPSGMKFDKDQGKKLYAWYKEVCRELLRVIKPGGFFWSFSSPRMYHNMASAVEDAGFLIKDQFIWMYTQNQPKAMSLNHVIEKLDASYVEKKNLKERLSGWKTPQVKSCHEPIVMAQKPLEGNFLNNYRKHEVGLINTNIKIGEDMFVSNIACSEGFDELERYFLVSKPSKEEKKSYNDHKTIKPIYLISHIINLCSREGQIILDPFLGSGTTCVSAKMLNRRWIGIEKNLHYFEISEKRLMEVE